MINEEEEKIEKEYNEMHQQGAKGILYVYNWERLAKSIPFLVSIATSTIGVVVMVVFFQKLIFNCITSILDLNIVIFPCLLGFTVGGYALIVGFAGVGELKKFTEKAKNETGSFFQLLVSIFSVSIFLQFATLTMSFLISIIIKSKLNFYIFGNSEKDFFLIVNTIVLFLIIFVSLWSLFTIPYVVINLFNFAQTNHSIAYTERMEDEKSGTDEEYQIQLLEEIVKTLKENGAKNANNG